MAQFLDIFGFLSVLLRGMALAFEALTLGGIIFVFTIARGTLQDDAVAPVLRWLRYAAISLGATSILIVALNSAILMSSTDLKFVDIVGSSFWISGIAIISGATAIAIFAGSSHLFIVAPLAFVAILAGSVMASHSVARLEHRWFLIVFTVAHHMASAAWIGGMPYLLITLRHLPAGSAASAMMARFSRLAVAAVTVLLGAGAMLAVIYVRSGSAFTGTTYGVMLLAKMILTAMLLLLGALNFQIVRAVRRGAAPSMIPLWRFAEAEVGIGFTILLAAASLTSTPPAADVMSDRISLHEVAERIAPRLRNFQTPPLADLSPPSPTTQGPAFPQSFVPGQQQQNPSTPGDIAWSEYNHHWAGLVVLAVGILALLSRVFSWARYWPLAFLGLAAFLLVRADPENWPLGPHGFWESFKVAEVAQHRLFVLLIVAFAIFEWAVQTQRLSPRRAGIVFPLVCAVGGALLMTHSHSLGNVKEEFLAELSHIPLAILAVAAGWCRWLEIRLPDQRPFMAARMWIAWTWPVCFVLIGSILILYREI